MATPAGMRSVHAAVCNSLWANVSGRAHVCNEQAILSVLAYGSADAHGGVPWTVLRRTRGPLS